VRAANYSLGIDIGGTFTDIVVYDHGSGRRFSRKELTTHDDPARGVMAGIRRIIAEDGVPAGAIGRVVHATTLFTNALIERKGAVTGLITTEGFADTLEIGRERKFDLYDINIAKPAVIVPRHLRLEVPERMRHDGRVATALDVAALDRAVERLVAEGVESLAVVFLHSYANPAHERQAAARIAATHPCLAVSASVDVAPEVREYERASTAAVNAYIKPLAGRYLDALAGEIAADGIPAAFLVMLSNGGLAGVEEGKRAPVQLLESGPAAGALAAAFLGAADGGDNLLAFDMGGTTAKLSVVDGGRPLVAYGFEAARQRRFVEGSGLPVRISTIELIEIGAGGGSIARIDAIGLMKVGPESAGSLPGPAAYGLGGTEPTVTDADFVLGYLNPEFFVGGSMAIDMAACRASFAPLLRATGRDLTAAAWGLYDIVNENMASAARVHIAERGRDPRRYTLFATGGAGPVHAFYVARKLGIRRVVCPAAAGVASALGLLLAPAKVDRMATLARPLDRVDWAALEAAYRALEDDARRVIAATGLDSGTAKVERLADMRFVGQAFEIVVALPPGPYAAGAREGFLAAFEATYVEKFTRTPPSVPVEIVNIRASVSAQVPESGLGQAERRERATEPVKGTRPVYFPELGEARPTPVYDRYALRPGRRYDGPAVIEEAESTLVVGPGGRFEVSADNNVIVTLPGAES
jgi:N-methylhydantoinase A